MRIGLKLNFWRTTTLYRLATTLIKSFRITRNFQAGVSWSWLDLKAVALQELSLRPLQ